ncbi:hypothetical protein ABH922_001924 [Rhodococcus sp. 27YEA15]
MIGWPSDVARYRADTSHAVCDGGAPSARPMGIRATAMIVELTGLRIEPRIIAGSSRRLKPGFVGSSVTSGARSVIGQPVQHRHGCDHGQSFFLGAPDL